MIFEYFWAFLGPFGPKTGQSILGQTKKFASRNTKKTKKIGMNQNEPRLGTLEPARQVKSLRKTWKKDFEKLWIVAKINVFGQHIHSC